MYENTYVTKYNYIFADEDNTVNIDPEYVDGIYLMENSTSFTGLNNLEKECKTI